MEDFPLLERMLRNSSCEDTAKIVEAERFLRAHPEPKQVQGLELSLIRAIVANASKARDSELVRRSVAAYDSKTWQIALDYCKEGISRAENLKPEIMLGTLCTDAGNCALNLAMRTNNLGVRHILLQNAVEYYTRAVKIADENGHGQTATFLFTYKADACKELAEINNATQRINWFVRAADELLEGAKRAYAFNQRHASRQYSIASSYEYRAATLATKTPQRQIELSKRAIEHAREAIRLNNSDRLYTARLYYDIGKYADFLYCVAENKEDARLALESYKTAIEQFKGFPSKKADLSIRAAQRVVALKIMVNQA